MLPLKRFEGCQTCSCATPAPDAARREGVLVVLLGTRQPHNPRHVRNAAVCCRLARPAGWRAL